MPDDLNELCNTVEKSAGIFPTTIKDSGERRTFDTGAQRDRAIGKGRFDLLPAFALELLAKHFEAGALKYSDRNWERGMPLSCFVDSDDRHAKKALQGRTDEAHWVAHAWNALCLLEGKRRVELGIWPAEFDDLPKPLPPEVQARLEAEEKAAPPKKVPQVVYPHNEHPRFVSVRVNGMSWDVPTHLHVDSAVVYTDDIRKAARIGESPLFQVMRYGHDVRIVGNVTYNPGPDLAFYTVSHL